MKFSGALPAAGAIDDQDARTWDALLSIEGALNEVQAAEIEAAKGNNG
jgi:hypothetical protein